MNLLKFSVRHLKLLILALGCSTSLSALAGSKSIIDVDRYQSFSSDRRAHVVGEPITILVVESTLAESAAGTGVKDSVSIRGTASDTTNTVGGQLGIAGEADGSGQTMRRGRVNTSIGALITGINDQGFISIEGSQQLLINGELQTILISGLIRPQDIMSNNTVLSNRIANADIKIEGDGDVSDANRSSLIFKVFQWLGIY